MKIKKMNRVCNICGCENGKILGNISMNLPEYWPIPKDGYDVVSCMDCGFTYADVLACQDDYNKYYATCNIYAEVSTIRTNVTKMINDCRIEVFLKYIDKEANIVDIGCGGGDFLAQLQKNGYKNLVGIDPSQASVQRVVEKLGIHVELGNIFDEVKDELKESFDVVCCTMVGEHIYDLNNFVNKLKQYVKPMGMIFIDVPCVEGFDKYLRRPANYFNHEHINYFSLKSLDRLFHNHGFSRITTDTESRKVLELTEEELVIEAIYKVGQNEKDIFRDCISEMSILRYFSLIEEKERETLERIKEYLETSDTGVVVWGTGSYCMNIVGKIDYLIEKIDFFVDSNKAKQGKQFMGKMVMGPEKLIGYGGRILVLIMQQAENIYEDMRELNIKCEVMMG